jgi:hypothetical protein
MEQKIRVFVSYSTKDKELVERLVSILEQNGITVLGTKKLSAGTVFPDQLKIFIEHAHIFMPVITEASSAAGWVHQEIGYAMGLHIPVFPVLLGNVKPVGMIESIHAIKLSEFDQVLRDQLSHKTLLSLLNKEVLPALYQRAAIVEDRATLIKLYADKVRDIDEFGIVRQKGGLSSFHIPDKYIGHQDWIDRYAPEHRGTNHKELQLAERKALQLHAENKGCKLIINPQYAIEGRSQLAAKTRINTMLDFLSKMPDNKVVIAMQDENSSKESLTMVGDWFLAESVSFKNGDGFTNTFFTRNASEIAERINKFDEELNDLLDKHKWTAKSSRKKAVEILRKELT